LTAKGKFAGMYFCNVYLPWRKEKLNTVYSYDKRIAIKNAKKFIKFYLEERISALESILESKRLKWRLIKELELMKESLILIKNSK
jgi:hypothetical protein